MENIRVYLAGPISGCNDNDAKTWRTIVKERLDEDSCIDPMRRDYRGIEDDNLDDIVNLDKTDIRDADVVLVNAWQVSWGTAMEILYSWEQNKPVVVVHPEGFVSPWVRYHAMMVVHSLDEAILVLETLDKSADYR
jgi:nucleoside 2-deoxyribosyltransferase